MTVDSREAAATGTQKKSRPRGGFFFGNLGFPRARHMFSIITWPKPEQLTCVAPSIRRAKS
jgi:hypothetical protein